MQKNLPTILVVEDEKSLLKAWVEAFRREGLNVLAANDADSALNLVLKFRPDLLLVDLVLSNADGFTLIKKIRENKHVESTPVMFLSGWIGSELEDHEEIDPPQENYYMDNHWSFEQVISDVRNKLKLSSFSPTANN
ncbi:MAG: response regulator [Candidatus Doudnabacteria bacterium]|nr:response regulator [Candidatus Doudnabacteria bacterium]